MGATVVVLTQHTRQGQMRFLFWHRRPLWHGMRLDNMPDRDGAKGGRHYFNSTEQLP